MSEWDAGQKARPSPGSDMSLILNIDTSTQTGGLSLSLEGRTLTSRENSEQKDHAAWMHTEIKRMLDEGGYQPRDLKAVAITLGPGSYTGLRVAMAAAKGFCYALHIPLITESSLKLLAFSVRAAAIDLGASWICPMIDARRMEVFTAIYSTDLTEILPSQALVLDAASFESYLKDHSIVFTGNGTGKWMAIAQSEHVQVVEAISPVLSLSRISYQKYQAGEFTDIIYSEPAYLKEFHTHTKK